MIQVTESAKTRLRELLNEEKDKALRIGLLGGGCAGFKYEMSIDDPKPEDVVYRLENNITIVMNKEANVYLDKITLDFVQTGLQSGFEIRNPDSAGTCGCGQSFSV